MILVNNPGSWKHVYPPLRHAEWHGWTPTDLVFPFFLFIVGVSISLSFSKRLETGVRMNQLYFKIIKRSFIIFALGIFLALIPHFDLAALRIPGVLQRIALCYLFSAIFFLRTGAKGRIVFTFSFLAIYWLVMKFMPVPGFGAGILDYKGNLCGYIDTKLLAGHLLKPEFDPEGILSTLPAISTTLLGTLAGDWLRSLKNIFLKTTGLFVMGVVFTYSGLLLHPYFPINKQLWTSTFVLFTAGVALLVLGFCFGVMEGIGFKKWASPFLIFGTNAIFVYVASSLMAKLISLIKISTNGDALSLKVFIHSEILSPIVGPYLGSLIYPLIFILIWLLIMVPFYRRRIFIKL
jgi:predicted acyltransferase